MAVFEGDRIFTSTKPEGFFSSSRSDEWSDIREFPTKEDTAGIYDMGVRFYDGELNGISVFW